MSENGKAVPLIICDFHMQRGKSDILSFFPKEEISRFHILKFETGKSLGRKVNFFPIPLGQQKLLKFQPFCVY